MQLKFARRSGRRIVIAAATLIVATFFSMRVIAEPEVKPAAPAETPAKPDEKPAPASTKVETPPTTAPATYTVKKGSLSMSIAAEGVFLPVDAVEVRPRLKAHAGALTITAAAVHGALVKQGDTLLSFDPTLINADLTAAEIELANAKATMARTEADAELGTAADARALRLAQEEMSNAEAGMKWWNDVDGPQMLLGADLYVRTAKNNLDDQSDELDQLRKMYKTEDLTTATADIVIKRAVRAEELAKINLKMSEDRASKVKTFAYPNARQDVINGVEGVRQKLAALKIAQEQTTVLRKGTITAGRLALAASERKMADLKQDFENFTFKAPADGMVFYGSAGDGAWQPVDAKSLRVGEKLVAGSPIMTLFSPGKLRLDLALPEAQATWVVDGTNAKVTTVAYPEFSYDGTCGAPALVGKTGAGVGFNLQVKVAQIDPRIRPGMKGSVKIEATGGKDALLVPVAAVVEGKVVLKKKDAPDASRDVITGRTDGKMIEIKSGLDEGDEILAVGKK